MIKFGIVGFGLAAKVFHLPIINRLPSAQVSAVCSSKEEVQIHAMAPETKVYRNVDVFLAEADIDVVLVLTPNDVHASIAQKALLSGKHVVIDKPFVCDVKQGQALIELACMQNKLLTVYHNRRWDGDFLTLKKLLSEGKLGELRYWESRFDKYRPRVWGRWREQDRPGAGLVFDLGSHLVDQVLHVLGKPQTVSAKLLQQRVGAEANDYFDIQLTYADNQILARLRGSSLARTTPFRFYVEGTQGTFIKQRQDVQEQQLQQNISPYDNEWGLDASEHYGQWLRMPPEGNIQNKEHDEPISIPTERGCYQHFYENLLAVIEDNAELLVSPEQALDVIKVIELAFKSSESGRELYFE